jgi:hypothetical protein
MNPSTHRRHKMLKTLVPIACVAFFVGLCYVPIMTLCLFAFCIFLVAILTKSWDFIASTFDVKPGKHETSEREKLLKRNEDEK